MVQSALDHAKTDAQSNESKQLVLASTAGADNQLLLKPTAKPSLEGSRSEGGEFCFLLLLLLLPASLADYPTDKVFDEYLKPSESSKLFHALSMFC